MLAKKIGLLFFQMRTNLAKNFLIRSLDSKFSHCFSLLLYLPSVHGKLNELLQKDNGTLPGGCSSVNLGKGGTCFKKKKEKKKYADISQKCVVSC